MIDATGNARALLVALAAGLLAAACATPPPPPTPETSKGTVVLLPEKDGRPSAVTVQRDGKQLVLDQPYAAAKVGTQALESYQSNQQDVEQEFGAALAAQPAGAQSFVLYFVEGKDDFTDESKRLVEQMLEEVARRPVPDVLVVGHTDAVGTDQVNDALGQRRAETVRNALIARGIPPSDIRAISRGKRALAVPTPDGVAEPRNRRVEIIVR
jgi:outer membrane protein OmpA-like peptidoglycan-associated protein